MAQNTAYFLMLPPLKSMKKKLKAITHKFGLAALCSLSPHGFSSTVSSEWTCTLPSYSEEIIIQSQLDPQSLNYKQLVVQNCIIHFITAHRFLLTLISTGVLCTPRLKDLIFLKAALMGWSCQDFCFSLQNWTWPKVLKDTHVAFAQILLLLSCWLL